MKQKTMMKFVSLCAAGGFMLQFGGCFGGFWEAMLKNVPIGAGRALGAIPAGIIESFISPFLAGLTAVTGT